MGSKTAVWGKTVKQRKTFLFDPFPGTEGSSRGCDTSEPSQVFKV